VTLAVAFMAGLISCLSPCVLPVIPVFAAYVSGGRTAGGSNVGRARAAGFLLGFAGVFVLVWVSLGLIGFALLEAIPTLRLVAGLAIIVLGAATVFGWQPMLAMGRWQGAGSLGGSFLLGAGVAVGWTPCIGPTLGAIITLAAASQTVEAGAALLVAYGLGMAVPLAVIGLGLSRLRPFVRFLGVHHRAFQVASGTLIVGVGVLVATGAFGRLAGLVPWGY
jgi:cytochrome c-type biogenesis protein